MVPVVLYGCGEAEKGNAGIRELKVGCNREVRGRRDGERTSYPMILRSLRPGMDDRSLRSATAVRASMSGVMKHVG